MNAISHGLVLLQAATANPTGQMVSTLVTFGLVFVIFYFLIIRPQNKKQKEMQKMIAGVKKGDKIVTIGGIHGTVYSVKEGTVVVKVDDDCKIEFSKSAIATVSVAKAEEKAEEPATDKTEEKK
ncbi:MAG: preprotein translocase subunit YajC [Spirochaetia bacterium]|nr:preprotein translocase subunit YajC [Spirochaetia bacterium]